MLAGLGAQGTAEAVLALAGERKRRRQGRGTRSTKTETGQQGGIACAVAYLERAGQLKGAGRRNVEAAGGPAGGASNGVWLNGEPAAQGRRTGLPFSIESFDEVNQVLDFIDDHFDDGDLVANAA